MAKGSIIRLWIVKGKKIESAIESEIKLRDLSSPKNLQSRGKKKLTNIFLISLHSWIEPHTICNQKEEIDS